MEFSKFKNLKLLSSNFSYWHNVDLSQVLLPSKLQVISLDFYMFGEKMPESQIFEEERTLLKLLQSVSIPSLREVVVPFKPHRMAGYEIYPLDRKSRDIWTTRRKALENADIFKTGQVKLRTFEPGDRIGATQD